MNKYRLCLIVLICVFFNMACSEKSIETSEIFTLYRNVPSDETFRVHVATFDAGTDGNSSEFYNWSNMKNCERAREMFQALPDSNTVKFWCEKGHYKK